MFITMPLVALMPEIVPVKPNAVVPAKLFNLAVVVSVLSLNV